MKSLFKTVVLLRFWILLALLVAVGGCGDPNRKLLVGLWQIKNQDKVERRITDDFQDDSRLTIEFRGGGKLLTVTRMGNIDTEKAGTWKMLSFDDENSKMQIECKLFDQTTEHEVEFLDEKTIKMIPPNMAGTTMKLKFERAR